MKEAPERAGTRPIGFIDSGVGGLTVLHECLVSLPGEDFLYLGDSEYFPYGTKSPEELLRRVEVVASFLLDRGVKMLVVACNSATAVAGDEIAALRERLRAERSGRPSPAPRPRHDGAQGS